MAVLTGFEPALFSLTTSCLRPLDDRTMACERGTAPRYAVLETAVLLLNDSHKWCPISDSNGETPLSKSEECTNSSNGAGGTAGGAVGLIVSCLV